MESNLIPGTLAVGFAMGIGEAERASNPVSNMEVLSIQYQLDRTDNEYVEAIGNLIGRTQLVEHLDAIEKIAFQKDLAKEVKKIIKVKKIIHRDLL